MAQRRSHVERAAGLTLGKHIVATQMDFRRFTGGAQLLEMTVAEFALGVLLVTDSLRVGDPLGDRRGRSVRVGLLGAASDEVAVIVDCWLSLVRLLGLQFESYRVGQIRVNAVVLC